MAHTRYDKELVQDTDYLLVEEHPAYRRSSDETSIRRSRSAIKVWLATTGEEGFLCRECKRFTAGTVQAIHSHQQVHRQVERKQEAQHTRRQTERVIVAFSLLPEKIRSRLLLDADKLIIGGE